MSLSFPSITGNNSAKITAQRVLESAAMGMLASQDNVDFAIQQLNEKGADRTLAPFAHKILRFLHMGLLPTVEVCEIAIQDIKNALTTNCELEISKVRADALVSSTDPATVVS